MRPDLIVHCAHMEFARPTVREGYAACVRDGATEVIVHPYMLASGTHATTSIPALVAEAATEFPCVTFRVTDPLGFHEKIAEVVLERAGIT
jgi:sirohydrochlorin ferrochelatase